MIYSQLFSLFQVGCHQTTLLLIHPKIASFLIGLLQQTSKIINLSLSARNTTDLINSLHKKSRLHLSFSSRSHYFHPHLPYPSSLTRLSSLHFQFLSRNMTRLLSLSYPLVFPPTITYPTTFNQSVQYVDNRVGTLEIRQYPSFYAV